MAETYESRHLSSPLPPGNFTIENADIDASARRMLEDEVYISMDGLTS